MRFARLAVAAVVVVAAWTSPAFAQSPTDRYPGPFAVEGSLDLVVATDGTIAGADPASSHLSLSKPMWITGWAFECRSGLQPQTQRIGQFYAYFTRTPNPPFGEFAASTVAMPSVVARPDVVAARQAGCPALGPNVGFWVLITPPDDSGLWTLNLEVMTSDGAGNVIWMPTAKKDVFIWP